MRVSRLVALALLALAGGCSERPETLMVGVHPLSVIVPAGWEHLDHGREQLLRNGQAQIAIIDLGLVTVSGYISVVEQSMALAERGDVQGAHERLSGLVMPRAKGGTFAEQEEFRMLWRYMISAHDDRTWGELEGAYFDVLDALDEFPELEVQDLTQRALVRLDHDSRRDIAAKSGRSIHGVDVRVVDTWDRLSHQHRKRFAFFIHRDHLFAIWTQRGAFRQTQQAFEVVLRSMRMRERQDASADRDSARRPIETARAARAWMQVRPINTTVSRD